MADEAQLYQLFNMTVSSEIPLPEAIPLPAGGKADVFVNVGPVPAYIDEACRQSGEIWVGVISEKEMWFRSPHALFHIRDGRYITAQPDPAGHKDGIRTFLLGSAFGFLMIQRGLFPVHGGSVVINDKVMILTGDSGAGKSTLTTLLVNHGCAFLADDVSVVTLENDQPMVLPGYPQRKLCRDAALSFGYSLDDLILLSEERQKYGIRSREAWCSEPMPLGCIVALTASEEKAHTYSRITGHDSLSVFFYNLYRSFIYQLMGVAPARMKQVLKIVSAVPLYRFYCPPHLDDTEKTAQALLILGRL